MKRIRNEYYEVCDRCERVLDDWAQRFASGHINIYHASTIGDIFAEGAGMISLDEKRAYFNSLKYVNFGSNPHQSLILNYGGDYEYKLCYNCSSKFILMLGQFFTQTHKTPSPLPSESTSPAKEPSPADSKDAV